MRDYAVNRRVVFISFIAVVIGAISTVAAKLLLLLINLFTNLFFYQSFTLVDHAPVGHHLGAWVIVVPALGGLLAGLIARYGSEKIRGHGIPEAMEAILFGKSRMSPRVAVLKPLSSGIVIGSGGPFGAEGPIIMTGGSLGSLLAQYLHVSDGERKALLVAGACAGMTAIFGTPIAAILLAVELLLFEFRPRSLLPVGIACSVAGFLRLYFFEAGPLFPLHSAPNYTHNFLLFATVGIAIGLFAAFISKSLHWVEALFDHLPIHWMWWPALGGLVVGLGGYIAPETMGVGYGLIGDLLNNRLDISIVLLLVSIKLVIWLVALGSGTSGGVLAPLLIVGSGIGVLIASVFPESAPGIWGVVGLSSLLGSVLGTPLTAIVFAFGLTHDTAALLPALLTTFAAWGTTSILLRRSIMTAKIAKRGLHVYREYCVNPLEGKTVEKLMNRETCALDVDQTVAQALTLIQKQPHLPAYPVLSKNMLLGTVQPSDLRHAPGGTLLRQVMKQPPDEHLYANQPAQAAAMTLARQKMLWLPVLQSEAEPIYVGVLSSMDLLLPTVVTFEQELVFEKLR
ncbi:chloride channel protein [Chitinolyticbacter meiyuanensis]|uniref:chloride channel protein n=1 Tax=Chitinolyticbacter meiyuanensis TaxID=682798 RepID=UPI0011E594DA|nr:chloride channel protein [Chitinolyticbacter meiyuanensis]